VLQQRRRSSVLPDAPITSYPCYVTNHVGCYSRAEKQRPIATTAQEVRATDLINANRSSQKIMEVFGFGLTDQPKQNIHNHIRTRALYATHTGSVLSQ
jgi:hypothetical protein